MRILVTGSAGFIGSHLCSALLVQGHQVMGLDAYREDAWPAHEASAAASLAYRKNSLLKGINVAKLDMLDRAKLRALIQTEKPDCIIHLAGLALVTTTDKTPEVGAADILLSTIHVLEAIRLAPCVKRFVYISSSMVYGNFGGEEVDETATPRPINMYGGLKLAGEAVTKAYLATTATEHVIVRPIAAYGPGDVNRRVIQIFCQDSLAGKPVTVNISADNRIDFTYIEDLALGLSKCCVLPQAAGETFNMSFGKARNLTEVVEIIAQHVPDIRVIEKKVDDPSRPRRGTLSIAKAQQLLGYQPGVNLEAGIARYISHLRSLQPASVSA